MAIEVNSILDSVPALYCETTAKEVSDVLIDKNQAEITIQERLWTDDGASEICIW